MSRHSRGTRLLLTLTKPRVAIPAAIVLLIVAAPLIYRSTRLAGLPALGDPFDVEAFGTVKLPEERNAFVDYKRAGKLLVPLPSKGEDELDQVVNEGKTQIADVLRKWLKDNRKALRIWKRGTTKLDAGAQQAKDVEMWMMLPAVQKTRNLGRLACVKAVHRRREGDPEGAWQWLYANIRFSRHIGRHRGAIPRWIGIALYAMTAEQVVGWAADPQVDVNLLKRALAQLHSAYELTPPTSMTVKAEYVVAMSFLDDELSELTESLGQWPASDVPTSSATLWLQGEPELARGVTKLLVANWLSYIDRSLPERPRLYSRPPLLFKPDPTAMANPHVFSPERVQQLYNRSDLVRVVGPAIAQLDNAVLRERARQRALEMALTAQWYYRDHGEFPETTAALRGDYLEEIPRDPLSRAGERMHYRRHGDEAVVWSVGENGVDDGGDLEPAPSRRPPDVGYRLLPPSASQ